MLGFESALEDPGEQLPSWLKGRDWRFRVCMFNDVQISGFAEDDVEYTCPIDLAVGCGFLSRFPVVLNQTGENTTVLRHLVSDSPCSRF